MGNYEALQKAERERRHKVAGEKAEPVEALSWDHSPQTAPSAEKQGLLERLVPKRGIKKKAVPVPDVGEVNKRRIAILRPESYVSEQFRMLRGRIDSLATQRPIRTVAMTSANPGEGKSTAAVNLAVVESLRVEHRVLLVDCDMRRPTVHRSLAVTPDLGIAEVLLGRASLSDAVIRVDGTNLDALVVRSQPDNPSELLASDRMKSMLDEMVQSYDRIILDTPATLGLPDSKTVSELSDGVVVVVRADVTPREEVGAVLDILDRRRILGMILNGADISRESYGYY
ncbi:MAG: CpsD/CapB family tyrosine-protein kinase [Myxococcota bacterium]|jgi:capsular exopolysaccharide synthesis family protein|nr:CpsD/CapB family tyrosine-protein kinase [Myxococcota bacterium]